MLDQFFVCSGENLCFVAIRIFEIKNETDLNKHFNIMIKKKKLATQPICNPKPTSFTVELKRTK